jgi:hypothetical protein
MAQVRETQITRDEDGSPADHRTIIERHERGGGFGWGVLLGIIILAAGIAIFAYSQGSFQTAGREADRATQTAQVQVERGADNAQRAVDSATDQQ